MHILESFFLNFFPHRWRGMPPPTPFPSSAVMRARPCFTRIMLPPHFQSCTKAYAWLQGVCTWCTKMLLAPSQSYKGVNTRQWYMTVCGLACIKLLTYHRKEEHRCNNKNVTNKYCDIRNFKVYSSSYPRLCIIYSSK